MRKIITEHLWWVTFIVALVLLAAHSFKLFSLSVDSTSILLLLIILISPFISTIKRIKYGDFEAEIDPKEIEKIKANSEYLVETPNNDEDRRPEIYDATDSIYELAESDPVIALAKIRIELEKLLGRLARTNAIDVSRPTLGRLVRELSNQEYITRQMGKSLSEVISICNRAIHGELISDKSAKTIVNLGVELIEEIFWIIRKQATSGTIVGEKFITPQESNNLYHNRKYRMTSVTPLVNNPKKVIRELTQEQLSDLLEDYELYAEFIVEIVEIKTDN